MGEFSVTGGSSDALGHEWNEGGRFSTLYSTGSGQAKLLLHLVVGWGVTENWRKMMVSVLEKEVGELREKVKWTPT